MLEKYKKIIEEHRRTVGLVIVGICICAFIGIGVFASADPVDYTRLNYDKYVTLGEYKNLPYTIDVKSVSDEDVDRAAESEMNNYSSMLQTGKPAEMGNMVVIDFTGYVDGKEFEGGSAKDYTLNLGSGQMIEGFEDSIIGHSEGDSFSVDLVFPKDYSEKTVAGKPVKFDITLKYVMGLDVPEYNEENVAEYTDYDTVEEHKEAVREKLERLAENNAKATAITQMWEQVLKTSKMKKYPKRILQNEINHEKSEYESYVKQTGGTLKEALKSQNLTEEKWDEQVKKSSKKNVKSHVIAYAIADKENIDISEKACRKYMEKEIKNAGMTVADFEKYKGKSLDEYMKDSNVYLSFVYQEVGDKIMELGVEKEVE